MDAKQPQFSRSGFSVVSCFTFVGGLTFTFDYCKIKIAFKRSGAVAQLGERLVRNEEVGGSIPLSSTIHPCLEARVFLFPELAKKEADITTLQ